MPPIKIDTFEHQESDENRFWHSTLAAFCGTGAWMITASALVIIFYFVGKRNGYFCGTKSPENVVCADTNFTTALRAQGRPEFEVHSEAENVLSTNFLEIPLSTNVTETSLLSESETFKVGTPACGNYRSILSSSMVSLDHTDPTVLMEDCRISLAPPFEGAISGKNLKELGFLGKGAFGSVTKVEVKGIKGLCQFIAAFKTVSDTKYEEMAHQRKKGESEILLHVGNHQNIVRLVGFCTTDRLSLLIEFCGRGSLEHQLRQWFETGGICKENSQRIMIGICAGMQHVIEHNIVHRDLACRNILLDEFLEPKIADFGLAVIMNDGKFVDKEMVGLPAELLALECFERGEFTEKTDVWAFGLLLYEFLTLGQQEPFPGLTEDPLDLYGFLQYGHRPHLCPDWCDDATKIITSALKQNPEERPSFRELAEVFRTVSVFRNIKQNV